MSYNRFNKSSIGRVPVEVYDEVYDYVVGDTQEQYNLDRRDMMSSMEYLEELMLGDIDYDNLPEGVTISS